MVKLSVRNALWPEGTNHLNLFPEKNYEELQQWTNISFLSPMDLMSNRTHFSSKCVCVCVCVCV